MYYFNKLLNNLKVETPQAPVLNESDKNIILNTPRSLEVVKPETPEVNFREGRDIPNVFERKIDHNDVLTVVNSMCNEIYERDKEQLVYVKNMAEVRGIDPEVLIENQCFFCPNPNYLEQLFVERAVYRQDYHITTSENTLWKDRFIIPIRDFNNKVYGFVGYSKFSNAKYVEWSSVTYKLSTIKALGLNHIEDILKSKYCILTEGVFDYFRGRQNDLSIIANLGISFNPLLKLVIDRVDVVFCAYDNDKTGLKNMNTVDNLHNFVYHIQFKSTKDAEGNEIKGDLDEALKDITRANKLKVEIEKRLKFKYIKHPKTILI